ncbi:MAG TPA: nuclear transport factor 2 family protein [Pyrinomonadaceae bacterium]
MFLLAATSPGQDKEKKPSTTVDAWRQALPSTSAPQPDEETPETPASLAAIDDSRKALLASEQNFMESLKVGDTDSLSQIVSTDFSFIDPQLVELKTRSQYLAYVAQDLKLNSFEFNKTTIQLLGRTAIVSSQLKLKGSLKGQTWSGNYLVTDVWISRDGSWRVVSRHQSPVSDQFR